MAAIGIGCEQLVRRRPMKTALHQAVLDRRVHQVRLIVRKHGGNVDSKDMYGRTPLMLACLLDSESDGYRMVKIFLDAGAYVNIRDVMNRTALHYACLKGRERIVRRFLLTELVEISTQDNDGNTALMLAALSGNPAIMALLCDVLDQFSAAVDDRNGLGYTALMLACKYRHFVSAHTLLTKAESSPALRDNEFFYNALDWSMKSAQLCAFYDRRRCRSVQAVRHRHLDLDSDVSGFSREHSMYELDDTPRCQHVRMRPHPLGQSLDKVLRLPAIFHPSVSRDLELSIHGVDAEQLVRSRIIELLNSPRYRPQSRNPSPTRRVYTKSGSYRTIRNPATAKLRALNPTRNATVRMNFRDLLDMYSDQYISKLLCSRPGFVSAPRR